MFWLTGLSRHRNLSGFIKILYYVVFLKINQSLMRLEGHEGEFSEII